MRLKAFVIINILCLLFAINVLASPPAEPSRVRYSTITKVLANTVGDSLAFTFAGSADTLFMKTVGDTLQFVPRTFSQFRISGSVPLAIPSLRIYGTVSGYVNLSAGPNPANVNFTLPAATGVNYSVLTSTATGQFYLGLLDSNNIISSGALIRDNSLLLTKIAASGAQLGDLVVYNGSNWTATSISSALTDGSIPLTKLSTSGAQSGNLLSYNGSVWSVAGSAKNSDSLGHSLTSAYDTVFSSPTSKIVFNDSVIVPSNAIRASKLIGTYGVYDTVTSTIWIVGADTLNGLLGYGLTRTAGARILRLDTSIIAIKADTTGLGDYSKFKWPFYVKSGSNVIISRSGDTLVISATGVGGGAVDSVGKAFGDEAGLRFTTNYMKKVTFADSINDYKTVFDTVGAGNFFSASVPYVFKGSSTIKFLVNDQAIDTITVGVRPNSLDSANYVASSIKTIHIANLAVTQGKLATSLMDSIRRGYTARYSGWDTTTSKDINALSGVGSSVYLLASKISAGKTRISTGNISIDTLELLATLLSAPNPFITLTSSGSGQAGSITGDTLRPVSAAPGNINLLTANITQGSGSAVVFGNNVSGNIKWYAAIKGGLVDGTQNGTGRISFLIRKVNTDAALKEAMVIDQLGLVGINKSTPLRRFHVGGKGMFDSLLTIGNPGWSLSGQLGVNGYIFTYATGDSGYWAALPITGGTAQFDSLGTKDSAQLSGRTVPYFSVKKFATYTQLGAGAGTNLQFITSGDTINDFTGYGLVRTAGSTALRIDTSAVVKIKVDTNGAGTSYVSGNWPVHFKQGFGVKLTKLGDTFTIATKDKADTLGTNLVSKGDTLFSTGTRIVVNDSLIVNGAILQVGSVGSGYMKTDTLKDSLVFIMGADTLADLTGYGLTRLSSSLRVDTSVIMAKVDTGTNSYFSMTWPLYFKEGANIVFSRAGDTLTVASSASGTGTGNGTAKFDSIGTTRDSAQLVGTTTNYFKVAKTTATVTTITNPAANGTLVIGTQGRMTADSGWVPLLWVGGGSLSDSTVLPRWRFGRMSRSDGQVLASYGDSTRWITFVGGGVGNARWDTLISKDTAQLVGSSTNYLRVAKTSGTNTTVYNPSGNLTIGAVGRMSADSGWVPLLWVGGGSLSDSTVLPRWRFGRMARSNGQVLASYGDSTQWITFVGGGSGNGTAKFDSIGANRDSAQLVGNTTTYFKVAKTTSTITTITNPAASGTLVLGTQGRMTADSAWIPRLFVGGSNLAAGDTTTNRWRFGNGPGSNTYLLAKYGDSTQWVANTGGSATSDTVIFVTAATGGVEYSSVSNRLKIKPGTNVTFSREDSTSYDVIRISATGGGGGVGTARWDTLISKDTAQLVGSSTNYFKVAKTSPTNTVVSNPAGTISFGSPGWAIFDTGLVIGTGLDSIKDITGYGLKVNVKTLDVDTNVMLVKIDTGAATYWSAHWPLKIKRGANITLTKTGDSLVIAASGTVSSVTTTKIDTSGAGAVIAFDSVVWKQGTAIDFAIKTNATGIDTITVNAANIDSNVVKASGLNTGNIKWKPEAIAPYTILAKSAITTNDSTWLIMPREEGDTTYILVDSSSDGGGALRDSAAFVFKVPCAFITDSVKLMYRTSAAADSITNVRLYRPSKAAGAIRADSLSQTNTGQNLNSTTMASKTYTKVDTLASGSEYKVRVTSYLSAAGHTTKIVYITLWGRRSW